MGGPRRFAGLACALSLATLSLGCGGAEDFPVGSAPASGGTSRGAAESTLSLVAYSTPEVVYHEILSDFRRTEAGSGVAFKTSFGASGEQSRAVEAGLPADVVSFSIEPDMQRLVEDGLVDARWRDTKHSGFVSHSVVAFIVRAGNPKRIRTWDDLLRDDVEVVTPNPFTSGAAKWNLLGAYAHGGLPYVEELIEEQVRVQPKSGREALQAFTGGAGDVLLSYEYEAVTARRKGEQVDYVIPDDTLKIDIVIATTQRAPAAARSFLDYVLSAPAQQRFADWGYRPVDELVLERNRRGFPVPRELATIEDLGGWAEVNDELFDPESGSIAAIEEEAGVSTAR